MTHPDRPPPDTPNRPPSKLAATAATVGLSLLFMVVYGSCNWITSQRSDVGTWYYAWERFIPLVPVMIIPYMSIDLFFVAGPYLCRTKTELQTLALRISFAILVAGLFFLLMPLTLAVPRPQVTGWAEPIFSLLYGFDQPYNLFPSLHITLRTILASLYARHTRGFTRLASNVWFSLIGLSTLLTYQHHIVDVAGGFVLAAFCFYLFRESSGDRPPASTNPRVGAYYALGALAALGAGASGWPWTGILLWPALSLGIAVVGYGWLGAAIYGKRDGRLPWSSRLVLAPCLLGQYLSLLYYRRQCEPWNVVTPRVWIGVRLNRTETARARKQGMTSVLDLTVEFSEHPKMLDLRYCNLPTLDLTAPTQTQLQRAARFISDAAEHSVVLVHCKIGYSRSAAAVGAYLLASGQAATVAEVISLLRRVRPSIVIRPEVVEALLEFESRLGAHPSSKDQDCKTGSL